MHTLDVTECRYIYRIVVHDGTRLCGGEYTFHFNSVTSEIQSAQVFITIKHHNCSSMFRLGMLKPSSGCIYMVYEAKLHKTVWIKFMDRLRCQFLPFRSLPYSLIAY
jgi:hypothetical protein